MPETNVYCENNCGNRIKRELAEKHSGWSLTEDGGWLCTACNPDSPVSWESDSDK